MGGAGFYLYILIPLITNIAVTGSYVKETSPVNNQSLLMIFVFFNFAQLVLASIKAGLVSYIQGYWHKWFFEG